MSTNPTLEEINDVYTGLLALSKLFVQSSPKDAQQSGGEEGFVPTTATDKWITDALSSKHIFPHSWPCPWDRAAQEDEPHPKLLNPGREALLRDGAHSSTFPIQRILTCPENWHHCPQQRDLSKELTEIQPHLPTHFSRSFSHSVEAIKAAIKTTSYVF